MKVDFEVKMILVEVFIFFVKGCDIFIIEFIMCVWIYVEENKCCIF